MRFLPANLVAPAWMLASVLLSTGEMVVVHELGPGWPPMLQLFWRQGAALFLLLPFVLRDPRAALRTSRPGTLLFRSVAAMSALALTIYALTRLPIANATALSFTRPLWIVLLAALMLGERVGRWRAGAIAVGFAGTLVMLAPSLSSDDPAAHDLLGQAAVLGAALLFALSVVSMKSMSADNDPMVIMVYGMIFGILVSVVPAWFQWRTPTPLQAVQLGALGVFSLTAFVCFLKALTCGDAIAIVPFDYLRLPLAMGAGLVFFGEQTSIHALAGGGMIIAATLSVTLRERYRARRAMS